MLVKAHRPLRPLVLYLYDYKMVALGVLERLVCEERMMAKCFIGLSFGDYILLVKQSMELSFANAVFFRISQVFSSLPNYESDPARM